MLQDLRVTKTVHLREGSELNKRQEILDYFEKTFSIYEELFKTIKDERSYFSRPEPLRHPLIFYYGHTAVFFINKLILAKTIKNRVNPRFESIFAIGVDEMSWDDLNEDHYDWPSVDQVREYRNQVRDLIVETIQTIPLNLPIDWESPFWPILMGIEHERIHLETSSMIIRQLPVDEVAANSMWARCLESGKAPENSLLDVPGKKVRLGKSREMDNYYGWDNEYGNLSVDVPAFKASKYLVSNDEFLQFVEDEGYSNSEFWTDLGDKWRQSIGAKYPRFWIKRGDEYSLRLMLEEIPMPWDWPCEVNYYEAKAFCNWKSKKGGKSIRLPTEEEWYSLRDLVDTDQPDWEKAPFNINLEHYASPNPVNQFEHAGFYDIFGNVWQWTETPISGFSGFKVHPLYDDFSTPTFDGKHHIFKGGSWISTGNEALKSSRYAFRCHFFQHAGFRYIESEKTPNKAIDTYETDSAVSQYIEFHYGREYFDVENFPRKCAQICSTLMEGGRRFRALDVGCSVGRSTLELAKHFDLVVGVDFSARFIKSARELLEKGRLCYTLPDEGELVSYHEIDLENLGLDAVVSKVEFWQQDACNLKERFTNFDLIFCGNLIDRLYDPKKFLESIHTRLNRGGLLVLTSPYTWLLEYTEREYWLGGVKVDGENLTTYDALKNLLEKNFREYQSPVDVEFVIRETKRKFQHTVSQMTVWEKL